jgi:hypothetical protein
MATEFDGISRIPTVKFDGRIVFVPQKNNSDDFTKVEFVNGVGFSENFPQK